MTQLKVLGGLKLEPSVFTQPKPLVLLSYLSLEGPKPRRHLAELFWPEGKRMKSLSMTLTRLRQGAGDIIAADDRQAKTTLACDAKLLLEFLDNSHWQRADELYTGAFLDGVVLDDCSNELEDWIYTTREYLAERVQYALLKLAEEAAKEEDFVKAGLLAERAYRLPGLTGHDPGALKRLYPLLCASQSLLAPSVRKEAESFDLSLALTTEQARAIYKAEKKHDSSLPVRNTSFVGRATERYELIQRLRQPGKLLLSLVGTGGVGKTRLALQIAHEVQALGIFQDGVYFVSLEALKDTDLLFSHLVSHFELNVQGQAEPFEELSRFLAERSSLLVLDNFEHLSQDAARVSELLSRCVRLKILITSRETLGLEEEHVVRLEGLAYPQHHSVKTDWDAVQLFYQRAQQARAQFDLSRNLPEVIRICQLVEGLPLGIELAAGWLKLMSCTEITQEIEMNFEFLTSNYHNIPERHRSLKVVFESSWNRLTLQEQQVLRKLSVFRGGFRREAAAQVSGATISILASLVDKSLLRVLDNGRYDRHPLLYQFTQEKLAAQPLEQAQAQSRHASFYLALISEAEPQLHRNNQVMWFARLDDDLENLREALRTLEHLDPAAALQLATALTTYWHTRNFHQEGFKYLERLWLRVSPDLQQVTAKLCGAQLSWEYNHDRATALYQEVLHEAGTLNQTSLQIKALLGLGRSARLREGDFELAHSYYQRGLELALHTDDKAQLADAYRFLGALHVDQGNYQLAKDFYQNAIQLDSELGDHHSRAKCLTNMATVLTYLGDYKKAHQMNVESLGLFRAVGDKHGEGIALLNLGMDASNSGDRQEGIRIYQQSLAIFRELNELRMISHLLNNLAGELQKLSRAQEALELLEESLTILTRAGDVSLVTHAQYILGQVYRDLGEQTKAFQCYQECIQLCRKNNENWALMRVLEVLGQWYIEACDYIAAKETLEASITLAKQAGDKKTLEKALTTMNRLEQATLAN